MSLLAPQKKEIEAMMYYMAFRRLPKTLDKNQILVIFRSYKIHLIFISFHKTNLFLGISALVPMPITKDQQYFFLNNFA